MLSAMLDALARAFTLVIVAPVAIFSAFVAAMATLVLFLIAIVRKLADLTMR